MAHPVDSVTASGDHRLRCLVVTPEKTWLDQSADSVIIPLFDGELGILPGRSPLIGRLGFGELKTKSHETVNRYFIDGGFAQVKDDVVTILTNRALPADQVDASAAAQELSAVQTQKTATELDAADKAKNLARIRAKLRVAKRRG
jgi:F-type H+-transporting ATPase subunit epsilon